MRMPKRSIALVATVLLMAAAPPAIGLAQNPFARSLANLSNADREAMDRSRSEVLAKMQQGAVSIWKDDKTGHSGETRIARTFEQNGRMCAEVDHFLKLPNESHYVIPFCRDATGAWRAVF